MDEAIIFEITGKYGLFKKPYSPLSPVSYPVPPPTAIYGIIGAIAGFSKDMRNESYYLKHINNGKVLVGIKLLNPVRRYRAGLNYLITKDTHYFRPKGSHLPEKRENKYRQENPRTQIPAEFLVDPAYRIYFFHSNPEVMEALKFHLVETKTTVYTPYFGMAQCISEIKNTQKYPQTFPIETIRERGTKQLDCVIPLSRAKVHFRQGEKLFRFRLPALMDVDRTVTFYEDVIVNENALPITVDVESYEIIGDDSLLLLKPFQESYS